MELHAAEGTDRGPKRKLRLLFVLFISVLLILTIYSNTLLTMNLPKAWTEEAKQGQLVQHYSDSSVLQPVSEVELSNKAGWNVNNVLVKEGDRVTKGQVLVTYDTQETETRIQDQQTSIERQRLTIAGIQERYVEAVQSGDDPKIRDAKRDLELSRLDMDVLERNLRNMHIDLENKKQIVAPFEGLITKLAAVIGLPSGSAGSDVRISNSRFGYQFTLQVPSSVIESFKLGDKLNVKVVIKGVAQTLEGTLTEIKNAESTNRNLPATIGGGSSSSPPVDQKRVLVTVKSEDLQGGEQASLNMNKTSTNDNGVLLPAKAIHGEGSTKFIFIMAEKKGPLGNTYHASKVFIEVGDTNEEEAIVLKGAYPGQVIITDSSEPLQDGSRVRQK
ncbi:putative efflux system component YknX [Paenibacillus marchantiophytorum]|uniref:Efflux system component YknX n=1 Tax=Paenibacillus marchantiophytorum TaxID=1619310 RepID=A0ABQ1FGX8_9BACL|nr:biotin/lipoyl-binding protein [Paenibacillus marchantiophytorum]GGA11615.1 putative efflux system component YknX [Paenibacillus marchantiophytorum]